MLLFLSTTCNAHLASTFYHKKCPNGLATIRTAIRAAVSRERRMAASLIRLHFHDCFVQVRTCELCWFLLVRQIHI
jgi:peroxidase